MEPCRHCNQTIVRVGYSDYEFAGGKAAVQADVPVEAKDTIILTISGKVITGKRIPEKDRKKYLVGGHLRSGCYYGDILQWHVCEAREAYIEHTMAAYQR